MTRSLHSSWLLAVLLCLQLSACASDQPGDSAPAQDPLRQSKASVVLSALGDSGVTATATFVATVSGVDLSLTMRGCEGLTEKPVRIVAASDCARVTAATPVWDGARGAGIPGALCTTASSGEGLVRYARRHRLPTHWTIGDGSETDVVGRALVLLDPASGEPSACGVINRDSDRTLLDPQLSAASAATRARLAGSCWSELMAGAAAGSCSDPAELSSCAAEHCELGACLAECESFTACMEQSSDACADMFTCPASEACRSCQLTLQGCTFGFCGEHLGCPAIPRPGGPCSQMTACCTLQGEGAGRCLEVAGFTGTLGGEASCINGLSDWDVISHMHVPCATQNAFDAAVAHEPVRGTPLALDGAVCLSDADCAAREVCVGKTNSATLKVPGRCLARAAAGKLEDGIVGAACSGDASCGSGRCAQNTPLLTPFPDGHCTGACHADADCGQGGVCLDPAGATEAGVCYRGCASDGDCAREHYRCTPLGDGRRVVTLCYPRNAALPDGIAGQPCTEAAGCSGGATCLEGMPLSFVHQTVPAPGGYCSHACLFDEDCGAGAQCISAGISGGLCMASCSGPEGCRQGYRCVEHLRDADPEQKVCMPIWDESSP